MLQSSLSLFSLVRARGTLFVSHLPHDMNEAELQSLFPDSIAVRIIFNRSTGLSKGYLKCSLNPSLITRPVGTKIFVLIIELCP